MKNYLYKAMLWTGLITSMTCAYLSAEIERVTVKWNPVICVGPCPTNIARSLAGSQGVADFLINPQQGQADIRWNPLYPFRYDIIHNAVSGSTGIPILDIRVQVRGLIGMTSAGVVLQSLGDNTQFLLLGNAPVSTTQNVPQYLYENRALSPALIQQFSDAQRDFVVTVVSGPLLRASQGLTLVVEQVNFIRIGPNAIAGPR